MKKIIFSLVFSALLLTACTQEKDTENKKESSNANQSSASSAVEEEENTTQANELTEENSSTENDDNPPQEIDLDEVYYSYIEENLVSEYGVSVLNKEEFDTVMGTPPDYSSWSGIVSADIYEDTYEGKDVKNLLVLRFDDTDEVPCLYVEIYGYDEKVKKLDSFEIITDEYMIEFDAGWNGENIAISYTYHYNYVSSKYGSINILLSPKGAGFISPVIYLADVHSVGAYNRLFNVYTDKTYFETDKGVGDDADESLKILEEDLKELGITDYEIEKSDDYLTCTFNHSENLCKYDIYSESIDYTGLRDRVGN